MGYTTEFKGRITISPEIKSEHRAYINVFSETRRMRRHAAIAEKLADPARLAAGLPVGPEGGYYVGGAERTTDVVNYNDHPTEQPGLWCQWVVADDSSSLQWDGGEKFCSYVEWLEYLIEHFFKPWGYELNGSIKWRGEEFDDTGTIVVTENIVSA